MGQPSGRFVLRISPQLHAELRDGARAAGVSLNDYCTRKLTVPGADQTGPADEVIRRAVRQFGPELIGVLAYGSWARGELTSTSDLDLLVVVAAHRPIRRDLYREWDGAAPGWEGLPVEAHFVHLPDPEGRISAVWAEAAMDGVVLFERGHRLSRALVRLRRRILGGALVRRHIHGQTYWVEAA